MTLRDGWRLRACLRLALTVLAVGSCARNSSSTVLPDGAADVLSRDAADGAVEARPDAPRDGGAPAGSWLVNEEGWGWRNPWPQGNHLRGVWIACPGDVW